MTNLTITLTTEEAKALAGNAPGEALVSAKDKVYAALLLADGPVVLNEDAQDALAEELDPVTDALAAMLADTGGSAAYDAASAQRTGRGPTGKMRNFAQMKDAKLLATFNAVDGEANDAEAREALVAEMAARGL